MIVVDSSVWIDYFCGNSNKQVETLDQLLGVKPIAIGDLILVEVLQGFKHDKDYRAAKALFESVIVLEMLGIDMAIKSAKNFRALRKKGITIRKTADIIIASYCIENHLSLLFSDKDFKPFAKHLGLIEA